jgi:hypothetical protein
MSDPLTACTVKYSVTLSGSNVKENAQLLPGGCCDCGTPVAILTPLLLQTQADMVVPDNGSTTP